ncbi:flagellar hook-associated protein 1 [Sporosarcina newyorkensis 2681]|uniref:Flagellar hook-associated protein 1 n=1 Tax=Sporosarcina newyorkensis 2681 TaxID=1027292 RepID=F9DQA1_9BACL|nr:flagellar hook-associated protein FlgK [Sporosarcina newyorkensis]EGQ26951.1 flagellar hook-associated protein 1 [Sporosarcina newyorkensis 2681]
MRSTFMGLETSKRGLYTQQSALYTTGHNISNANTLGYSRQRVNMQATSGFPGVGMNAGTMPGFLGTGVEAGSIQRIRDGFVDKQFRDESNKLGYWESQTKAIAQMEDVLAEPSKYGLQQSLSDFWQSLQTLAANPENGGARAVVVERGVAVADSFNYIHKSLKEIQKNLKTEIDVSTTQINSVLKQIGELNRQIAEVEPNGYLPNDLYDERDRLLDELSTYVPIEVSYEKTGGRALAIAEGTVTVSIKTDGKSIPVVRGKEAAEMELSFTGTDETSPFKQLDIKGLDGGTLNISNMLDQGQLKSLINSYGTEDGKGLYPEMIDKLDLMAKEFAREFNKVHSQGFEKSGTEPGADFFGKLDANGDFDADYDNITAGNIIINSEIEADPNKVAASSEKDEVGNGKNAKNLGDVMFNNLKELGNNSVQSYLAGEIVGKLGVKGQQAVKMTENSMTLLGAVSNRRDSISSVSLDEEMTDMIRFQQAYNASARMVTVMDETLDKIINGMGVVGR